MIPIGKPIPAEIPTNPPWIPDAARRVEEPFYIDEWLDSMNDTIEESGADDQRGL